ncbi:MAG: hypothetical protein HND47_12600 [Chloroflexi bacterium]|nr:hypothetical protein [Chloroflexota bacterium]
MKHKLFSIASLLVLVMLFAACAPQGSATDAPDNASGDGVDSTTSNGSVEDLDGLIDALAAGGAQVAMGEPIEQPFFSVTGQILKVNEADVQVFSYQSAEAMEADAALVAPDGGSVGTQHDDVDGDPALLQVRSLARPLRR